MLSESAADDLADIFETENNSRTSGRTNLLNTFTLDSKRKLHSRNVERQTIDISGYVEICSEENLKLIFDLFLQN